ncbi:PEP-CTERM sorting domain-containing protein [Nitrosospira multiformis]|uniref:PEP-CTERM protein-sorting domain-containing protein n=1 Tax=Nitrosospira multiformis TaxID=1231 RepID=A0A1I7FTA6_9PROT|nr:PEP-CTERM sorting domain-containing protein [Nitrosospira multiformis]SFU39401.1 PEP-CTERM protein-sorting domain-containing protein [Nitrosospira multiformis]
MYTSVRTTIGAAIISLAVISSQAFAFNDIHVGAKDGKIVIDQQNTARIESRTGYKLFTSDLIRPTMEPGYLASADTFLPGEQLWIHAISTSVWNGTSWITLTGSSTVEIEDSAGSRFRSDFGTDNNIHTSPYGLIGVANTDGGIHGHLNFTSRIVRRAGGPGGADLLTLQLTTRDASGTSPASQVDSDPFHIVFNRGLSNEAFAQAVNVLASPVPEAETYAMLLAGLGLIGFTSRRRKTS